MNRYIRRGIVVALPVLAMLVFSVDSWAFPYPQERAGAVKTQEGQVQPPKPGEQGEAPLAAKIEDINAHRRKALPFIRSFTEQVKLDLAGVDYDADVVAVINGYPVTQELFRMYLVMYLGELEVDKFMTALMTQIGMEIRLEEGADPETFKVSEERVDEEIENQLKTQHQLQKMPEMDMEVFKQNIDATYGWERYRDVVRATVVFGKVFLPDIEAKEAPAGGEGEETEGGQEAGGEAEGEGEGEAVSDEDLPVGTNMEGAEVKIHMPLITWNALAGREQERTLRDMLNKNYAEQTPLGGFLRPHFTRVIKEALLRNLEVEFFYTGGLKPGVFLRIEDKELMLDALYPVIAGRVTDADRMMALREVLLMKGMDFVLEEAGCALSEADFQAAFAAHQKEYEGTLFTLDFMIRLHGYLTMARYKNVYRRRVGFEKLFAPDLNSDEVLKGFYESAGRLLYENGSVKIQVIFFGVYDHKAKAFRENGFEWAKGRMAEVQERLKAGEEFEALAKEYEDPEGTFTTYDFQLLNRQHLRMALADQSLGALLEGFSLADYVFYRGETDEIVGPLVKYNRFMGSPSHQGVYLAQIKEFRRSQILKPYDISKKMVVVDYADLRFPAWAQEALEQAEIKLTYA
jgi:hypothetical protein